ncbi:MULTISPECIES: hypothetical protein [unclassified Streptomyces]|uniref:hypothetical protein n=1 Tax=unclassified Streptomyces TaxID=2593676 RepID=UPI00225AB9F6|nr:MULTISPECIES: hypothetical protein [unclassified Streptomyces]MCX5051307.1 hypothetical protein [Streptomyces sp. NBC_00474]MCX5249193.1 hypothetical protein [Streptomyces sp. NBC_00201]
MPPQVTLPDRGIYDTGTASSRTDGFVTGNGEYGAILCGAPTLEKIVVNHDRFVMPKATLLSRHGALHSAMYDRSRLDLNVSAADRQPSASEPGDEQRQRYGDDGQGGGVGGDAAEVGRGEEAAGGELEGRHQRDEYDDQRVAPHGGQASRGQDAGAGQDGVGGGHAAPSAGGARRPGALSAPVS